MIGGVPIARFERKYLIFPEGRVWNIAKDDWHTLSQNPNGYWKAHLKMNGQHEQLLIHRIVAMHFLPNPYEYPQVNHKNGNKNHNNLENLEWISRSGNINHSLELGLRAGYMSPSEKQRFLQRVLDGEPIKDIALEIGRGPESLTKILREMAEKTGKKQEWAAEMKRRRADVAIRNLEAFNFRHPSRIKNPIN